MNWAVELRLPLIVAAATCLAAPGLTACGSSPIDVNLAEFDRLPQPEDLDYAAIQTAQPYDYWELRFAFGQPPGQVLGSVGSKAALPADIVATLDTLHSEAGFAVGCPPARCYKYIVSVKGSEVESWTSIADLQRFLGPIDTPQEAALLTDAHSYYWGSDKKTGAIRAIDTGFEIIALKLVKFCAPVQVNRYLLRVSRAGELSETAVEVWEKDENICI